MHAQAFQLFLEELYMSHIILVAAIGVYLAGVHSATWLKNRRTAMPRSSIWRWRTPRKLQDNYCHPSFPDQRAYKLSELMKRRTLRAMYPLALFRGYTQQPKPKQRKQKPKERCWLKEILKNIWNRGRMSVGEAERLLSQSRQSWSHKTSKRDEEKMQMVWGKGLWFSPFWSIIVLFLPVSFSSNFFFSSVFHGCNVTIVNLNKKPNQNKVSITVKLIYPAL